MSNHNIAGGRSEVGPTQASTRIEADLASRPSQGYAASTSSVEAQSLTVEREPDSVSHDKAEKKSGKFRLGEMSLIVILGQLN